jgi:hypothetical protein
VCQRGVRESPPGILGAVILVISGPGRMMYRSLEPKPEGSIYRKRSDLRERHRSPHDTAASMSNWLAIGTYKGTPARAFPAQIRRCGDTAYGSYLGSWRWHGEPGHRARRPEGGASIRL